MNDKTDDDAYDALFRSYEDSNRRIKELDAQLVDARIEIAIRDRELKASDKQLAAAQADAGFWGRATAKTKQEARRLAEVLDEAKELLLQAHEPDQGQLRTQWDKDVDEWIKKAAHSGEGEKR